MAKTFGNLGGQRLIGDPEQLAAAVVEGLPKVRDVILAEFPGGMQADLVHHAAEMKRDPWIVSLGLTGISLNPSYPSGSPEEKPEIRKSPAATQMQESATSKAGQW